MNIRTVTVQSEGEIVVGEWYLITGLYQDGKPCLPQVFFVRQKHLNTEACGIPFILGDLFLWQDGKKSMLIKHAMPLPDINIPEHGLHDVHMERLNMGDVEKRLRETQTRFREAQKMRREAGDRPTSVTDEIYGSYFG